MFETEVKLFILFDILGDTVRSGMIQWKIERKRLEDIKNHILDLILIAKILERYISDYVDINKVIEYIIIHDLPEAITGDITKFEGVSDEEIDRVNNLAIEYIIENFSHIMNFKELFDKYESKADLESKVVKMIDKVHSASTFIKYQAEKDIDMNKDGIMDSLRHHPFVEKRINEGYDLADIFYEFHIKAVAFSDTELDKYSINRETADKIVFAIKGFADELYKQKWNGSLLAIRDELPENAMVYNKTLKELRNFR